MKAKWEKQESRLANLLGGERSAGSGNGRFRKGDVRSVKHLVEAKQTDKASFVLKLEDLKTIGQHADTDGCTPVFAIEMQGHNYVVLREADWIQ